MTTTTTTYYTIVPLPQERYYRIGYVCDDGRYGTEPQRPIRGLAEAIGQAREMATGTDEIQVRRGDDDYVTVPR